MSRDYYDLLGVARQADGSELKSAFRKLAMEHHPDRNGGCEDASTRFKEINEAYSVLSDPDKRAAYDRFGHAGVNGQGGFGGGGGAGFQNVNDIFTEVFGDVFGDMFNQGRRSSGPVARRRPALRSRDQPGTGLSRRRGRDRHPGRGHLRQLRRLRRQAGHRATACGGLRRRRSRARSQRLLCGRAHLSALRRRRSRGESTLA